MPPVPLSLIVFPANVQHIDKAVDMLGGTQAIAAGLKSGQLHLRWAPDSLLTHPIPSSSIPTRSLVLKRHSHSHSSGTSQSSALKIVGIVYRIHGFAHFADFQPVPISLPPTLKSSAYLPVLSMLLTPNDQVLLPVTNRIVEPSVSASGQDRSQSQLSGNARNEKSKSDASSETLASILSGGMSSMQPGCYDARHLQAAPITHALALLPYSDVYPHPCLPALLYHWQQQARDYSLVKLAVQAESAGMPGKGKGGKPPQGATPFSLTASSTKTRLLMVSVGWKDEIIPVRGKDGAQVQWDRLLKQTAETQSSSTGETSPTTSMTIAMPMALPWMEALPEAMAALFQERHSWSLMALWFRLVGSEFAVLAAHPQGWLAFRSSLYTQAYQWTSGPWLQIWTRFGFDPRKDPSTRHLQPLMIRWKASHIAGRGSQEPLTQLKPSWRENSPQEGQQFVAGTARPKISPLILQIIDVQAAKDMTEGVDTEAGPVCHERFGFWSEKEYHSMKQELRRQLGISFVVDTRAAAKKHSQARLKRDGLEPSEATAFQASTAEEGEEERDLDTNHNNENDDDDDDDDDDASDDEIEEEDDDAAAFGL